MFLKRKIKRELYSVKFALICLRKGWKKYRGLKKDGIGKKAYDWMKAWVYL